MTIAATSLVVLPQQSKAVASSRLSNVCTLTPWFSCSVKRMPSSPRAPGARHGGKLSGCVAPRRARQGAGGRRGAAAETCSPLLHQSCGARLSVPLCKRGRGISGGSLTRHLLFLRSWQCWSTLAWARQQPGCRWRMLERWTCCHGTGRCLRTPAPAAESAPSSTS